MGVMRPRTSDSSAKSTKKAVAKNDATAAAAGVTILDPQAYYAKLNNSFPYPIRQRLRDRICSFTFLITAGASLLASFFAGVAKARPTDLCPTMLSLVAAVNILCFSYQLLLSQTMVVPIRGWVNTAVDGMTAILSLVMCTALSTPERAANHVELVQFVSIASVVAVILGCVVLFAVTAAAMLMMVVAKVEVIPSPASLERVEKVVEAMKELLGGDGDDDDEDEKAKKSKDSKEKKQNRDGQNSSPQGLTANLYGEEENDEMNEFVSSSPTTGNKSNHKDFQKGNDAKISKVAQFTHFEGFSDDDDESKSNNIIKKSPVNQEQRRKSITSLQNKNTTKTQHSTAAVSDLLSFGRNNSLTLSTGRRDSTLTASNNNNNNIVVDDDDDEDENNFFLPNKNKNKNVKSSTTTSPKSDRNNNSNLPQSVSSAFPRRNSSSSGFLSNIPVTTSFSNASGLVSKPHNTMLDSTSLATNKTNDPSVPQPPSIAALQEHHRLLQKPKLDLWNNRGTSTKNHHKQKDRNRVTTKNEKEPKSKNDKHVKSDRGHKNNNNNNNDDDDGFDADSYFGKRDNMQNDTDNIDSITHPGATTQQMVEKVQERLRAQLKEKKESGIDLNEEDQELDWMLGHYRTPTSTKTAKNQKANDTKKKESDVI